MVCPRLLQGHPPSRLRRQHQQPRWANAAGSLVDAEERAKEEAGQCVADQACQAHQVQVVCSLLLASKLAPLVRHSLLASAALSMQAGLIHSLGRQLHTSGVNHRSNPERSPSPSLPSMQAVQRCRPTSSIASSGGCPSLLVSRCTRLPRMWPPAADIGSCEEGPADRSQLTDSSIHAASAGPGWERTADKDARGSRAGAAGQQHGQQRTKRSTHVYCFAVGVRGTSRMRWRPRWWVGC